MAKEHAPAPGVYVLGPKSGKIQIKTFKEGLLSALGHDLTLDATEWRATLHIDALDPPSGQAEVDVPVAGIRVAGPEDLSADDREEILKNLRTEVLKASKHPKVRFRSASSEARCCADGSGTLHVEGELELAGAVRKLPLLVHFKRTPEGLRLRGEAAIRQSEFGVKPYRAPLGVIKVKDEVRVLWDILIA